MLWSGRKDVSHYVNDSACKTSKLHVSVLPEVVTLFAYRSGQFSLVTIPDWNRADPFLEDRVMPPNQRR